MNNSQVLVEEGMKDYLATHPDATEKQKALFLEFLNKSYVENKSAKEILEISDKFIDYVYGEGYRFYQSGNYEAADKYFLVLIKLDQHDTRALQALIASKEKQKKYKEALLATISFNMVDPFNPLGYYFQALIFQKMDKKESALLSFQTAVLFGEKRKDFDPYREISLLQIQALTEQLQGGTS